ncbi:hypothetical protein [uncultured Phascolarctobacterium sp.]|uniref:hypothetical protein n=1 Tax=uncultured Phascolarctobacterium sp. TaxID=512296 RepID=UPI0025E4594A|nr:hypothetical protein [uncultured Phascolarctobacterium sp.]
MVAELILETCVALREGREENACTAFSGIIAEAADNEALQAISCCLLVALRHRQRQLFAAWMQASRLRLEQLLVNPQLARQGGSFLLQLAFAVCDRRLSEERAALALLARRWLRTHAGDTELLQKFMAEWLNLAARMARRRWREETAFLLREAGRWLLKQQDLQCWAWSLQQLQLHFVVYARWDGFDKACRMYRELTLLYRLLLRRVPMAQPEQQAVLLQLLLRHLRDVTANVSRSAMLDDADIFRQWYSFWWQLTAEDKSAREELLRLLQLAITYWQQTMPKTSRKQIALLKDLLQPNLIVGEYALLLQKII